MPEICRFFGIVIRMYFDEHDPPHIHVEYHGSKGVFDLNGNILQGNIGSRTAIRLVREWIDLHSNEILENWNLARSGKGMNKIAPLD